LRSRVGDEEFRRLRPVTAVCKARILSPGAPRTANRACGARAVRPSPGPRPA
jgi:hypothetical protein